MWLHLAAVLGGAAVERLKLQSRGVVFLQAMAPSGRSLKVGNHLPGKGATKEEAEHFDELTARVGGS